MYTVTAERLAMPKFRDLLRIVDRQGELARLVVDEVRKGVCSPIIRLICRQLRLKGTLYQLVGS